MIREEDVREAIAEMQGQKNPNANTCIKLAAYYIIQDHISEKPAPAPIGNEPIMYSGADPDVIEATAILQRRSEAKARRQSSELSTS